MLGHGGSQSLQTPSYFSPAVAAVVRSLGIDLRKFESEYYDHGWRSRHGLEQGYFFARETFGTDRLVRASRPRRRLGAVDAAARARAA